MSATLEIVPIEPKPLQTRASFKGLPEASVLGNVQVADEAGFAYLDGDIDFGAIGRNEIFQNIKYIVLTEYFSVPLDREFGFDYSMVDKPMAIAEAIFSQECAMKITLYEPRAQFREIDFARDEIIGKLSPSVKVVLLTENEGTSLYRTALVGEAAIPAETKATIAAADAFTGKITGLEGKAGDAGAVLVGQTITGKPGEPALVVNVGSPSIAVLDFTIPEGLKGDPGQGINIKGQVPTSAQLPPFGNEEGDTWIAQDTGHGWSWDGVFWIDMGPIQGPKGDTGTTGATGQQGATGATGATGAPGQIWRGPWNSLTAYNINDAVEYLGSTYICTGANSGEAPPAAGGAGFWTPPLANTATRGSVPPLSPSLQQSYYLRGDNSWAVATPVPPLMQNVAAQPLYYLRGDNTWAVFQTAWVPPVGSIVQTGIYSIQTGGATGAVASVYGFTSAQGALWGTYSFTPKYANSIIRASFSLNAQSQGAAGWCGWALFAPGATYAFAESWGWTNTVNAGFSLASSGYIVATSTATLNFQGRGGIGTSGQALYTQGAIRAGCVFIDEVKQ